jgi:hypothetical protein
MHSCFRRKSVTPSNSIQRYDFQFIILYFSILIHIFPVVEVYVIAFIFLQLCIPGIPGIIGRNLQQVAGEHIFRDSYNALIRRALCKFPRFVFNQDLGL